MFQFTMFVANLKIQWKSFFNVFYCKMKKKIIITIAVPNPQNASTIAQTTTNHHLKLHIRKKSQPPKHHQPPNHHQPSKKLPPTIQKNSHQNITSHQTTTNHPKNNQKFILESQKTSMNPYQKLFENLRAVQRCLSFHNSVLNFHNSNSKPITHNSNSTITQKIQNFCLVTKLNHVSQFLTSLFAKIMDPPTDTTQKNTVATRVPFFFFFFCSSNSATPKPSSTTTNGKPFIHHH